MGDEDGMRDVFTEGVMVGKIIVVTKWGSFLSPMPSEMARIIIEPARRQ